MSLLTSVDSALVAISFATIGIAATPDVACACNSADARNQTQMRNELRNVSRNSWLVLVAWYLIRFATAGHADAATTQSKNRDANPPAA